MAEDDDERTEAATSQRREKARARGNVPQSRDLASAVVLLAAVAGFHAFGELMIDDSAELIRYCLQTPWMDLNIDRVRVEIAKLTLNTLIAVLPWTAVVVVAALAYKLYETGGLLIAAEKDFFDLNRLNFINGFGKLFSKKSLVRTGMDIIKVLIIGLVCVLFLSGESAPLAVMTSMQFPKFAGYAIQEALTLAYQIAILLIVLGVLDYVYQVFQNEKEMRMTKQEVKQEAKDIEGDPTIRMARRRVQMEMARKRMMKEVPEADVVVTNPTELAVAIKYEADDMEAPVIVAMGAGVFAKRIREIAAMHRIPIIENKPLAQLLFKTAELSREIPEDTFVAVAELLAYVYRIGGRKVNPRKPYEEPKNRSTRRPIRRARPEPRSAI